MHTLKLRHEISIHALTSKVWSVLTSPDYTQQFLIEGEIVSEWTNGSRIFLEQDRNGNREKVEKGIIHEAVPGISLHFTLFHPGEQVKEPLNFLYELLPEEGGVRLVLTQETIVPKEDLFRIMSENSMMMLQKIKWLAEYS
jgi:uncharacterized protein YndB with AHSA1/START domain